LRGAEHAATGHRREGIGQSGGEWCLWPDDDKVDFVVSHVVDQRRDVGGVDGHTHPRRAGVPRSDVK
jgi:hypothetical protein